MYEFKVEGMTCGGCTAGINKALKAFDPQSELTADLATQIVRVQSEKGREEISKAIQGAGFPVLEAKTVS